MATTSTTTSLTVSAPGKLLLAGGYLVLESPNDGVVIGVNRRFYCTVVCETQKQEDDETTTASAASEQITHVKVQSPQFQQEWSYEFDNASLMLTPSTSNASENGFVEKTLRLVLSTLLSSKNKNKTRISSLCLTLRGDNDFYSLVPHLKQRDLPVTLEGALKLPPFLPVAKDDGKILKTGLGSSACLVTSLVAALYHALKAFTTADTTKNALSDEDVIFRLAQICHCHAQGKVGSGFDVSAACYGSHMYQRFPKETIADLLETLDRKEEDSEEKAETTDHPNSALAVQLRTKVFDTEWKGGLQAPLSLPPYLQVMLADVSGGSESPSMARTVLAWKKTTSSSSNNGKILHWDDLAQLNRKVGQLWQSLPCTALPESELDFLSSTSADKWREDKESSSEVGRILAELHSALAETRTHLKAMGDAAQVPIEPPEQTELADATLQLPGVVAALVPGAGGYDALACVYINTPKVRQGIDELWSGWPKASVCPLTVQAIGYGEGVRIETTDMSK